MIHVNKLLLTIISLILSFRAFGVGELYEFAETNREIVTRIPEVATLSEPQFHLTSDQADQVVAITALDRQIDAYAYAESFRGDCDDEEESRSRLRQAMSDRSLRFYFSLTYSGEETYDRLDHLIERETYSHFMLQQELSGITPLPARGINTLISQYQSHTGESLDDLSPVERARALEAYIQSRYGVDVPRDLLIEETLRQQMIRDPNNWRVAMQGVGEELNFEQKMRVAARMGNTFLGNYNNDRAGTSDGRAVTMEELLSAAQNNTPGGVCRDISFAQSQMLQEMGVNRDNIYIMAYATPGSYHSVLAVQDPENPDNLVKLNYGEMTYDDRNTGAAALAQYTSLPDVGISYRIFDADARPVGRVPTELGGLLREVTNAPQSIIQTRPYNLSRVGASSDLGNVSLFTGTTSTGDHVVGAAFDTVIARSERQLTEVGVALLRHERDGPTVNLTQDLLYARISSEFSLNALSTDRAHVDLEAGYDSEILYGRHSGVRASGSEFEGSTFDFSNTFFAGVSSSYELPSSDTLTARARVYIYPDFANETEAKRMTLAYDRTEASIGYQTQLTPEVRALAETGVILRQYGEAAFVRGALESPTDDFRAFASYSSPLSRDTPSFMPERDRLLSIGVERRYQGWNFEMNFQHDVDRRTNSARFNVERRF